MTPSQELAELRGKIEEFRKWLEARLSGFGGHILMDRFNLLFPPPKLSGAWCFFASCRGKDYRNLLSFREEEDAREKWKACESSCCNPSPVFFLPEEK